MLNGEACQEKTCSICGESTDNLVQHVMYHFDTIIEKCRNCKSDKVFRDFDEYKLHRKFQCLNYPNFNPDVTKDNERLANCYSKNKVKRSTLVVADRNSINSLGDTVSENLPDCKKDLNKSVDIRKTKTSELPIIVSNGNSSELMTKVGETLRCYTSKHEPTFIAEDKLPWSDQDPMSSDSEDFYITGLNGCRTSGEKKSLEKPNLYLCEICGKSYKVLQHLRAHWYKHQDIYSCKTCKKRFSVRSRLEMHIQRDHIYSSDHVCEVCGKTFCHEKFLQQHLKRHQKILMLFLGGQRTDCKIDFIQVSRL